MKYARKLIPLIAIILSAVFTAAQTIPPGTFKHIIIVVQENRTPDNLFGVSTMVGNTCGQEPNPLIPGADLDNGGYGYINNVRQLICNMALPLNGWDSDTNGAQIPKTVGAIDPDHSYNGQGRYQNGWGWVNDFDYSTSQERGLMDGFCHEYGNVLWAHPCPSYSYVPGAGDPNNYDNGDITPYFNIAKTYGFANYMFQTHEGPSFEAHQFLFTGTSAPVAPDDNYNNDNQFFAAELTGKDYGCQQQGNGPNWAKPDGTQTGGDPGIAECYAHDSLVTDANDCGKKPNGQYYCDRLVNNTPITWGWYQPKDSSIWNAPSAIPQTCYGSKNSQSPNLCPNPAPPQYTEYSSHVHQANVNGYDMAPIFDDLYNCSKTLPAISWVIPDQSWSDHPWSPGNNVSQKSWSLGPFWVGDIIDAVGTACGGKYWGLTQNPEPTAVFVTWDDWGGWYDHIPPWAFYGLNSGVGYWNPNPPPGPWVCNAPNGWGCGYVSGFRVPLLVVSPYTGDPQHSGAPWVSGACGPGQKVTTCPNEVPPYIHDFGSILRFTEYNFNSPNIDQTGDNGYADLNAPDNNQPAGNVPLSDFFQLTTPRKFVPVSIQPTNPWPYTCFQNWGTSTACNGTTAPYTPQDPDAY